MNKTIRTIFTFIFIFSFSILSSQVEYIHGGGKLDDWANLSKYRLSNIEVLDNPIDNLVIFMGNSITENWSHFRPEFFEDNPFLNRGIADKPSQMLIRFKLT